jgi:Na+/H+ antiporter NhaD/arsenite permease-like protein
MAADALVASLESLQAAIASGVGIGGGLALLASAALLLARHRANQRSEEFRR